MRSGVVIFSSGKEWSAAKDYYCPVKVGAYPYGECFEMVLGDWNLTLLHGGWGKVPAAAAAEYAVTHWRPELIINLGTCGGFAGRIEQGEVILVNRTVIYDIVEQMGDQAAAIQRFAARVDLSWLRTPYPAAVRTEIMVSADRDILSGDIPMLVETYGASAGDWESGAIAWVCERRGVRCLILRGVSDLVSADGGEAYGKAELFADRAQGLVRGLLDQLPRWLDCVMD